LAAEDCFDVLNFKTLSLPAWKIWQRIRLIWLNHHFVEDISAAGMPEVNGNSRQFFASKDNRPRVEKRRGLAIIPNHYIELRQLEDRPDVGVSHIPKFKFLDYEGWDRYASRNVGADFGSIGAFLSGRNQCGGLHAGGFHLANLTLHRRELSTHDFRGIFHLSSLASDKQSGYGGHEYQCDIGEVLRRKQTREVAWRLLGVVTLLPFGCLLIYYSDRLLLRLAGVSCIGIGLGLGFFPIYHQYCKDESGQRDSHGVTIVLQKYLTQLDCCSTVIDMANVLNADKQIAVIGALAEGSSIRSIERITGVHRDTIMRLGVKVGQGCATLLDTSMRNLPCNRLEMDEIWGFVGKKDRNVREGDNAVGSVWTFCAIDAETKLVPAFKCGDRDVATAKAFVQDVASRMAYRVQISTDGLNAYVAAMESAFGGNVDYAQIIKTYGHEEVSNNRRYSAPEFVSSEKKIVVGNPDERLISTSYIERLNATTRLHMRRLTRLTLAFSKKRENFEAAVALHFAYYNFVKRHSTIRCTPAMAAGVTGSFWSVGDLVEAAA
jgi:IS1 family transposase